MSNDEILKSIFIFNKTLPFSCQSHAFDSDKLYFKSLIFSTLEQSYID